ncbi:hypothetical protein [Paenibacillus luteus]|uniref:hypothetical protein n=1 Tax=Paenibacillus luteus TaxID=2545753 RepID=UPI0011413BB9|nr:hypothetical protein [Paenibacillus luteus]
MAVSKPFDKPMALHCHVLATEQIWLARILGEDTAGHEIWPVLTFVQCRQLMEQNNNGYQLLFKQLDKAALAKKAVYLNSKGT